MIPVLGIPILNRPNLLQRVFDTIDEPIGRLFIVDNGGIVKGTKLRWPHDVQSYHIADPGYNMGVAASWNHIIKANMNEPYWIIGCNDVKLSPGSLRALRENIEGRTGPALSRMQMNNEDWGNHFGVFAINAAAVEKVGWFDENLHPIYFEDTDWMRRAERLGVEMPLVASKTHHDGNGSWKGDQTLATQNKESWDGNVQYFDNKWASQPEDNNAGLSTWFPPRLSRLRSQAWQIERTDSGI